MTSHTNTNIDPTKIRGPKRVRIKRTYVSGKEKAVGKNPWWHIIPSLFCAIVTAIATAVILLLSPLPAVWLSTVGLMFIIFIGNSDTVDSWVRYYYNSIFLAILLFHWVIAEGWIHANVAREPFMQ